MNSTVSLSAEQREEVVRLYRDEHVSGNQLAKRFDVGPMVVYRTLYAAGVMRQRKPFGESRRCRICGKEKSLSEFAKCSTRPEWNYRTYECRQCVRDQHRERGYSLKNNTGLSLAQYNGLLAAQDGHCKLCETRPNRSRLHTDHDHAMNEIRGLLCSRCNRSMAAVDDAAWMTKALAYQRTSKTGLTFKNRRSS